MASIGHIAVGMAASRRYRVDQKQTLSLVASMFFWGALSMLPDADVLGFRYGIRYAAAWGHRGATHSLVFAVLAGCVVGVVASWFGAPLGRTIAYAVAVVASHPLLDTLTTGGLGCALLWPFKLTRYFAPWQVIPVAPIGKAFFSTRGLAVASVELILFAPLFAYALWLRRGAQSEASDDRQDR